MMENSSILRETTESFRRLCDVEEANSAVVLDALIEEQDESMMADLFCSWNAKGITANEIYSFARIMRERSTKVASTHECFIDIVGTGGSHSKTFNVSTAASFVVAGAGVPVAKHGNKAATSRSGSADVLSHLGIEPAAETAAVQRCLNEIGICFMYAPNFHRLSPILAKVRRGLGFPTIFNCVGPLCNPASPPHQLIGVWKQSMVATIGQALSQLGTKRSWIVYGEDGLDEISISGKTAAAEVTLGPVFSFELRPEMYKLKARETIGCRIDSAEESAALIRRILENKERGSAAEELVLINAASALLIAGKAQLADEGIRIAEESIRGGSALRKLDLLSEAVRV